MKRIGNFLIAGVNQLLWPAACQVCNEIIEEESAPLCSKCWSSLFKSTSNHYCRRCGREASPYAIINNACNLCQSEKIYFDSIARAGVYQESLRQIILKYKNGSSQLKTNLSQLVIPALQGSSFFEKIDFVVPVPLHWRKRLSRGYNQSSLLASAIAGERYKFSDDLVRIKNTPAQFSLSPVKRRKNVAGAFALRRSHRLTGKNICLVDDIKTTGATLNECAKILKEDGTGNVYALVVAVAGQSDTLA